MPNSNVNKTIVNKLNYYFSSSQLPVWTPITKTHTPFIENHTPTIALIDP